MRVTVQRVARASCIVEGVEVSAIQKGYLLLVGFTLTDTKNEVEQMAHKIANLRVFEDENGKMNHSIQTVQGQVLSISQFTLYADTRKGNRPSFIQSMAPDSAIKLYQYFNELLQDKYQIDTRAGIFGAHMFLDILCDGPVTINLEL